MAYIGNSPGVSSQRIVNTFTATAGQTTFTPSSGYTIGYVDVYLNGIKLVNGTDYAASNGSTVVFTEPAAADDVVEVMAYIPRGMSDGYTKSEADARYMDINEETLPDQSGHNGQFLQTDGTNADWATVDLTTKVSKSGDSMTGNLSFGDSDKAIFGAGSDLEIFHDGSHSRIKDVGTGNLVIAAATSVKIDGATTNENMAEFAENGAVKLFYDGSQKFATTSTGVSVTGTVAATSFTGDGSALTGLAASFADLTDTTVSTSDPGSNSNPSATGHIWVNKTSGECYVCTDATTNDNQWRNIGDGEGSINVAEYVAATGGTITTDGDYKVHTFTSSGTFTLTNGGNANGSNTVDVLVVSGGAGGGSLGGGGGAGGTIYSTSVTPVSASIVVGGGGSGGTSTGSGTDGGNSNALGIAGIGGGGGAGHSQVGRNGGSGGGGSSNPGGTGTSGQGNAGGTASGRVCGGGGGKGAAGANGSSVAGNGGVGAAYSISGTSIYYAGGGGGSYDTVAGSGAGTGGNGGGGNGGSYSSGTSGSTNRGGGGGGGFNVSGGTAYSGGNGGSGIVIIRYKFQN